MHRKLIFVVLMFSLVSTSYGYVLGDWESTSSLDGWSNTNDDPLLAPHGNPELYPGQLFYNTTLNDRSLLMIAPIAPEPFYWQILLDAGGLPVARASMMGISEITIAVTRPTAYWVEDDDPNTVATSTFKVKIMGGGPSGGMFGTAEEWLGEGLCEWNGTDSVQRMVIDYPTVVDTGWWMRIIIGTNNTGWAQGGVYYLDNARIEYVPEPMTIALMGLGGLGLLRRKR